MFEAIQLLVSAKKLEDGFGMDNVAVVNGKWKITRLFRVYTFDLLYYFSFARRRISASILQIIKCVGSK